MNKKTYEKFAESLVRTHQTPGAIVALTNGYEQGFGYRDRENQLAVMTDTVFGIGSITKVMTSIAILQLQEAGKLSVDDLIQARVPEVTFTGSKEIKLHHLMTHTSGMPPMNTLFYANKKSMEQDGSFELQLKLGVPLDQEQESIDSYEDLIHYLNTSEFDTLDQAGQSFSYSNDGYALLGMVVERVSGQTYEQYMDTHIFQPLGMKSTFFDPAKIDERAARLYGMDVTAETPTVDYTPGWWDAPAMWAAGYVKSTAADMLRFGDVFLTNGGGIIRPESVRALTAQQIEIQPGIYYGYGVIIQPDFFGTTLIEHGGSIKGVAAQFSVLPEKGIAGVCLTNMAGAPSEALLKGALQSELNVDLEQKAIQYEDYELTALDREQMAGVYKSNEGQSVTVYEKEEAIYVEMQGADIPARPVGKQSLTIPMHGTDYLLQFKGERLHFAFRQLVKAEE